MAKPRARKVTIPHHVQERYRHQNLQRLLEDVASHIPQLPTLKNETKAKKLRRILLYMRFLLEKRAELPRNLIKDLANFSGPEIRDTEGKEKNSKVHSNIKHRSCPPHIVLLGKLFDRKMSPITTKGKAEEACTKEKELECNKIQEAKNDDMPLANEDSSSEFFESHHETTSSLFDNVPRYSSDEQPTYEFYTSAELETKTNALEKHALNAFVRPHERNTKHRFDNSSNQKESNETSNAFNATQFSYIGHSHIVSNESDSISARNSAVTLDEERNAYQVAINNFNEKYVVVRNNPRDKPPPSATYIPPRTCDDQEKYTESLYSNLSNANDEMQKNKSFSQDADNFQSEFFSSGESGPIASSGETAPVLSSEWVSSDEMEYGNLLEKTAPELFNPENNPPRAALVEDSFDSCDIYYNPSGAICDMEQYMNFNQGNMQANMHEHYGNLMAYSNLGMINAAGYDVFQNASDPTGGNGNFCPRQNLQDYFYAGQDYKEDRYTKSTPFQVNNLSLANKFLPDLQNDKAFEVSKTSLGNFNRSDCEGYPEIQNEDYFSEGFPTSEACKYFGKPNDIFVPHESTATIDLNEDLQDGEFFGQSKFHIQNDHLGCQANEGRPEFGHSSFRVGSECYGGVKVKQEDIEPQWLAEEISYSLNNLDNADWY